MKKFYLNVILASLISISAIAQDTYIRPAVSIINLDFQNNKSFLDLSTVVVPKNLDKVSLSVNRFNVKHDSPEIILLSKLNSLGLKERVKAMKKENEKITKLREDAILLSTGNQNIANSAILSVVPIVNGNYNYDAVLKRGINSATDQDVNLTSQNKMSEGNEEDRYFEIAEKVLNKNYVVALNMSKASSFSDENSSGFEGSVSFYVLKIQSIYSNGDLIIQAQQLPEADIKSEIVASGSFQSQASNSNSLDSKYKKSSQELKKALNDALIAGVWAKAQRKVDGFQPKTTLLAKKEIALGTKENLKIDNRFFVFQNEENKKGEVVKKKKATMRVKKVANNDGKATGASEKSKLYKIGYGKAGKGMLVQQKEDLGIGISVGYGDLSWLRFDYRLKGITPGLLLFLDAHPYPGKVEFDKDAFLSQGYAGVLVNSLGGLGAFGIDVEVGNFTALAYNVYLGAEKQMRLGSAFYLSPFIGGGYSAVTLSGEVLSITSDGYTESYSWITGESDIYGAILAKGGARFGFQLSSALSLNFTAAYVLPVSGGWSDPSFGIDGDETGTSNLGGFLGPVDNQEILENYYETVIKEMPNVPDGLQTTIMLRYEF